MLLLSFLFLLTIGNCLSANILAVTLLASPSHYKWHKSYFFELVRKGHNVTVVAHDKAQQTANYTVITLEGVYEKLHEMFIIEDLAYNSPLDSILLLSKWNQAACKFDLESKGLKVLLNYPENYKFDLVIWDVVGPSCLYPLIKRFGNPPIIATSPFGAQPYIIYRFGSSIHPYMPFYQSPLSDRMSFWHRLQNSFYLYFMHIIFTYWTGSQEEIAAKAYFGKDIGSLNDFHRNISLLLVNFDPAFHYPEPLSPNIIPVGGLHIQPQDKIPKDLEGVFAQAKQGVIFVSLGTNIDFNKIERIQRQAFFEDFKKLPYTILLKSKKGDFDVPDNVILREWYPQDAILAHPKTKLFITHGGSLSTEESLYYGVPILGIPFFFDQFGNIHNFVVRKFGKSIDYFKISPNVIYDAALEILNNPIYKKNMEIASEKHRNQLTTPLQRAIYWTEYILKYGPAEHLSPATRDMTIFQRLDLDILFTAMTIIILSFTLVCVAVVKLYKRFCSCKQTKVKQN